MSNCIQNARANDLLTKDCIYAEERTWDRRLNGAYSRLRSQLADEKTRASLDAMQQRWIKYRDARCDFYFVAGGEGTASRVSAANCLLELTVSKTVELESLIHD